MKKKIGMKAIKRKKNESEGDTSQNTSPKKEIVRFSIRDLVAVYSDSETM
jgi:hypothetical protein